MLNTKRIRTGFDDMDADAGSWATSQEKFWASEFGDEYSRRCSEYSLIENNVHLFRKVLREIKYNKIDSVIEFGANIGLNLEALGTMLPGTKLDGIEINESAANILRAKNIGAVYQQSILSFKPKMTWSQTWDLVLVKGVLIHINPECLPGLYDTLYASSGRYICLAEYYNPTPVEVPYRGHDGKLFKRDFAGEMLDRYPLKLVDYGFQYHRDKFPADDITWFLMEKA